MTDQQWRQAWEIYRAARELPEDERRSYLATVSDDPEVFEEVAFLLKQPDLSELSLGTDLAAGARIGRYEILGKLGRGGMGQVYSARDPELGRIVALKLLAPEWTATRLALDRLIREAKAASALNHPHIVTIYEVVHSGNDLAIAMELIEGESLRAYCRKPQPPSQVIHWGRQIAQALAAAHARGIVHHDIKPENLIVRPDGYAKVLDFSLARQSASGEQNQANQSHWSHASGAGAGTLNYMAPEQTRSKPATAASDIFSLGVVLFELVTGVHPFLADSPLDTAHAIAYAAPKSPLALNRQIPPALNALILQMLSKTSGERPSADEIDRKLAVIEAVNSKPRHSPRLRWLAAALTLGILAAIGIMGSREMAFSRKQPEMIQLTRQSYENAVIAAALSPDGKTLAFAMQKGSLYLRRMSDGFTRPLNTPGELAVDRIAWFADGSRFLISGALAGEAGVWLMPTNRGKPALLLPKGKQAIPSPDGTQVAFIGLDGSSISVMTLSSRIIRPIQEARSGVLFSSLIWSPDSRRVVYERQQETSTGVETPGSSANQNIKTYQYSLESADVASARVVQSVAGVVMTSACALPDGRIEFLHPLTRNDAFHREIWELRTDPYSSRVLEAPRRLLKNDELGLTSISASNDGKEIAAVRQIEQSNVYVADLRPGSAVPQFFNIRRLTVSEAFEFPHAWIRNQAIVFESNRNGNYQLFVQGMGESEAKPLVDAPGSVMPQASPDGKWILYASDWPNGARRLMRVSVDGGTPASVPIKGKLDEFRCALQPGSRCVIRSTENDQFVFHNLDPVLGEGRELARAAWAPAIIGDWDISPDGSQVAVPNHDPNSAEIRLVPIENGVPGLKQRVLPLKGITGLNGVVWSADGKGLYVALRQQGEFLWFTDLRSGRTEIVTTAVPHGYPVPSPDGRHLAFPYWTGSSNVWLYRGL